jgi:epoxyqueuosine reductase
LRNAAIVLGNQPVHDALPALSHGLNDPEPLVRGACAWALGNYQGTDSRVALERRYAIETDLDVKAEIELALRIAPILSR